MTQIPKLPLRQSFSLLVSVTPSIPSEVLTDWIVEAQLRRHNNSQPSGLLATFDPQPFATGDPEKLYYLLYHEDTSNWPVGLVELDLAYRHPATGYTLMTQRRSLELVRSVTRNV